LILKKVKDGKSYKIPNVEKRINMGKANRHLVVIILKSYAYEIVKTSIGMKTIN